MFVIHLTYKVKLEKVDQYLDEHIDFLNEQYALGNFLASGRKVPRTGGILKPSSEIEEIRWLNYEDLGMISEVDKKIFRFLKEKGELE